MTSAPSPNSNDSNDSRNASARRVTRPWHIFAILIFAGLVAMVVNHRFVTALGRTLPALPDTTHQSPAMVAQLLQADLHARRRPLDAGDVGGMGMVYHANLFIDHAIACYTLALNSDPANWQWIYLRTLARGEKADADELVDGFGQVVALNPQLGIAWYRLGDAEFKRGGYARAEHCYKQAQSAFAREPQREPVRFVKSGPVPLVLYARLGEAQAILRQGRLDEALALAEGIVAERDYFAGAFGLMEQVYRVQGKFDDAERCYKLAWGAMEFHQPPDPLENELWRISCNTTALLYAADLAVHQGDQETAIAHLERAVEVNPRELATLVTAGRQFHAFSHYDRSLEMFNRAAQIQPDNLEAQTGRAKAMISNGQTIAALTIADALIAQHPMESDPYVTRGLALAELGDYTAAEASLRRAHELGVVNPGDFWPLLGTTLNRGKRWDAAIEAFKSGLAIKKNNVAIRVEMASSYTALGRVGDAIEQLRIAMQYTPNDSRLRHDLAEALVAHGDFEEAHEVARKVTVREPWSPRAHVWYAGIAARAGRITDALQHCQTAIDLAPSQRDAYDMMEQLRRLPPASIGASRQTTTAPASLAASVQLGRSLYHSWCAACHSTDGSQGIAPTFHGLLGRPRTFADGQQRIADETYIRESILNPPGQLVKGFPPLMPKVSLRDHEIASIVAFIKSLE